LTKSIGTPPIASEGAPKLVEVRDAADDDARPRQAPVEYGQRVLMCAANSVSDVIVAADEAQRMAWLWPLIPRPSFVRRS
jgi:hypothetical protein